jgi:hypothetical protein
LGCGLEGLFWFIFFGIDPKKKQKKSRAKDAASALFLRLEKLEKTAKRFFCFSTAPKFTPPPARLLPEATALNKASFMCLRLCTWLNPWYGLLMRDLGVSHTQNNLFYG